ncbi:hypothetical protein GUITHDRAFT_110238 [Guillardia theta CCMP2712]|uniref:Uncharacterized protein n=1 Tax=Guillardia theta (strain CCMP2712) TaxID=905079 RepID=L1J5I3_GUITC|nr:hypothetical protein GUITHDRAFT_110238 [Guillardia theta CCMP2712]EKX43783.1 hypothetical protein GUITHDRAFT_110238 [Guillardia theta CCMP2712]|eukprot:XP_005830763.1 hypothetical protein GUITHDRAFT_110238 [Guillardia theta CCMP2712]
MWNKEFMNVMKEKLSCKPNCTCLDDCLNHQPESIFTTLGDAVGRARREIQEAFGQVVPEEEVEEPVQADVFDVRQLLMTEEEDEDGFVRKMVRNAQVWDEKEKTMDPDELSKMKERLFEEVEEKMKKISSLLDNEPPYPKTGPPNATGFEDVPGLSKNIANEARELGLKPKNVKKFMLGLKALDIYMGEKEEERVVNTGEDASTDFEKNFDSDTFDGSGEEVYVRAEGADFAFPPGPLIWPERIGGSRFEIPWVPKNVSLALNVTAEIILKNESYLIARFKLNDSRVGRARAYEFVCIPRLLDPFMEDKELFDSMQLKQNVEAFVRKVKFSKRADFCLKKCDWIAESLVVEPRPTTTAELLTKQILSINKKSVISFLKFVEKGQLSNWSNASIEGLDKQIPASGKVLNTSDLDQVFWKGPLFELVPMKLHVLRLRQRWQGFRIPKYEFEEEVVQEAVAKRERLIKEGNNSYVLFEKMGRILNGNHIPKLIAPSIIRLVCGGLFQLRVAGAPVYPDICHNSSALCTPLHAASLSNQFFCCRALLAAGANPNARDSIGVTPLMLAAFGGAPKIVRLLLVAGADASLRNLDEADAYEIVEYMWKEKIDDVPQWLRTRRKECMDILLSFTKTLSDCSIPPGSKQSREFAAAAFGSEYVVAPQEAEEGEVDLVSDFSESSHEEEEREEKAKRWEDTIKALAYGYHDLPKVRKVPDT